MKNNRSHGAFGLPQHSASSLTAFQTSPPNRTLSGYGISHIHSHCGPPQPHDLRSDVPLCGGSHSFPFYHLDPLSRREYKEFAVWFSPLLFSPHLTECNPIGHEPLLTVGTVKLLTLGIRSPYPDDAMIVEVSDTCITLNRRLPPHGQHLSRRNPHPARRTSHLRLTNLLFCRHIFPPLGFSPIKERRGLNPLISTCA